MPEQDFRPFERVGVAQKSREEFLFRFDLDAIVRIGDEIPGIVGEEYAAA